MGKYIPCLLLLFFSYSINAQNKILLVRHVNVVDVHSGKLLKNVDVEVTGNRISAIAPNITLHKGSTIINADGKFLIPGLWDMHAHVRDQPESVLPELLVNGVTGFRETGNGFEEHIGKWKDSVNASDMPWARIVAEAGSMLDGPGDNRGNRFTDINNPKEAVLAVQLHKKEGADFIKVYDRLTLENYLAIANEAKKLHMPLDGHPPHSIPLTVMVNAGQQCFEHIYNFHFRCTKYADSIMHTFKDSIATYRGRLFAQMEDYAYEGYDSLITIEIAKLLKARGCWLCPTIVLGQMDVVSTLPDSIQQAFFHDVPERIKKIFKVDFSDTLIYKPDPVFANLLNREIEMLRIFHRDGVNIIAGTDASPIHFGIIPGYSLRNELALYVKAGFTNYEALKTATIDAAKFLGKEKEFGAVDKGKIADLVLLDANPLEDITNLGKINAVVRNGKYLDRKALDKIQNEIVPFH